MKRSQRTSLALLTLGVTALASSVLVSNPTTYAATTTSTTSTASTSSSTTAPTYTAPNAPVSFSMVMNKSNLDALHLKYSNGALSSIDQGSPSLGVLLTDGTNSYLATQDNGELNISTDGTNINITANHPMLNRYTSYSAYLLVGSAMHKYQAELNSGGHAQSFPTVSKDSINSVQFQTGSAIGEATHVTASVVAPSVSVTKGGSLKVTATDDYGNPATNATLTLTGSGKGNALVPSDFSAQKTTQITNGTVTVPLTDHSAEAVTLSYSVSDNTYHSSVDTKAGSIVQNFVPGNPTQAVVSLPSTLTQGSNVTISGVLKDVYGNGEVNQPISFAGSLTGALNSDTKGDFSGSVKVGSSGAVSATSGANKLTLTTPKGAPLTSIQTSGGGAPSFMQFTSSTNTIPTSDLPGQGQTMYLTTDPSGTAWAVTSMGVFKYQSGQWVNTNFKSNSWDYATAAPQYLTQMAFDGKGNPWLVTINEVYEYVNGKWVANSNVMVKQMITHNGNVYIVTNNGVSKLVPGQQPQSVASKILSQQTYWWGSTTDYDNVLGANFDPSGNLIVGYKKSGIVSYNLTTGTSTTISASYPGSYPMQFVQVDKQGNIWALTNEAYFYGDNTNFNNLWEYTNGQWVLKKSLLSWSPTHKFYIDGKGNFIFSNGWQVSSYNPTSGSFTSIGTLHWEDSVYPNGLFQDSSGNLYEMVFGPYGTTNGVWGPVPTALYEFS